MQGADERKSLREEGRSEKLCNKFAKRSEGNKVMRDRLNSVM